MTARRLRRLGDDAAQVVTLGAVMGREFDFGLLERVGPRRATASPATRWWPRSRRRWTRGSSVRRATIGRYTFTHALVRATLYDGVSQLRRARLHGRVGEAMAALHGADVEPLPVPARAPLRARLAGRAARAGGRLRARRARARRPAAGLGGGRRALPRGAAGAASLPARPTSACAATCWSRSGSRRSAPGWRSARARASGAAADVARGLGDAELLGRPRSATRGRGRAWAGWTPAGSSCSRRRSRPRARGDAAARAAARPARPRALLRGRAGAAARADGEAVALARRVGDPRALASASSPATTRCGGPRTSASAWRWQTSCAGWRRRPATPSSSSRARAGRWSTCSSSATWRAPTSRSPPLRARRGAAQPLYLWWTSGFRSRGRS